VTFPGAFTVTRSSGGPVPTYQILMHLEAERYLGARPVHSDDYVPAPRLQGLPDHQGVGFRYQGSALSRGPNRNVRVKLPGDDLLFGRIRKSTWTRMDGALASESATTSCATTRRNAHAVPLALVYWYCVNAGSARVMERKVPPAKTSFQLVPGRRFRRPLRLDERSGSATQDGAQPQERAMAQPTLHRRGVARRQGELPALLQCSHEQGHR